MPRSIVAVLFLVLAAVGTVSLLMVVGGDDAERGAAAGPPERGVRAPERGAKPPPSLSGPGGLARPQRESPLDASEPLATEVGARAEVEVVEAAAERHSVELEVVAAATGLPLAGAEVAFVTTEEGSEPGDFRDLDAVDGFMVERGRRVRTDAEGRVRLPLAARHILVTAEHDGLWGSIAIDGDEADDVVRLDLFSDATLRVQVVDTLGRPQAGVPVELRKRHSYYTRERTTAEDGMVAFPHVAADHSGDLSWSVAIAALLLEEVGFALTVGDIPRDVVQLVLPAAGSVEVRAFEPSGQPVAGAGQVTLGIVRDGEPRAISPFSNRRRETIERALEGGKATFHLVDLGQELEVQLRTEGSDMPTRAYAPGPVWSGGVTTIDVVVGADHPIVQLRAVEPGGAPLADTDLEVWVELTSMHLGSSDRNPVHTDAEGRFRVDLGHGFDDGSKRIMTVYRGTRAEPEGFAELDLSRALPDGVNDLGDVVVGAALVFVAGRVVDDAGAGVPGAKLYLRRKQDEETRSWWDEVWDFEHETDENGHFEVQSRFTGFAFQLGARGEDLVGKPVDFRPGDRNLVLVVRISGGITGSVLVDEDIPLGELHVRLEPEFGEDDAGLRWSDRSANVQQPGTFRLQNLIPGTYTVRLEINGDNEPLLRVEGVQVQGGDDARDPRLQEIDLRGIVHAYHFTVVAPDPGEEVRGNLRLGPAGGESKSRYKYFRQPEFDVLSRHEALDIDVTASGFRLLQLHDVRGDQVIELKKGIRVRIILTGDARVPEPPRYIKAVLVPTESNHLGIDWGAPTFDESREIVIEAPSAGRMKVQWLIEKRGNRGAVATSASVEPVQFVEIADTDVEQTVEVHLTQEQLEKILEQL